MAYQYVYRGFTLLDITPTGVTRHSLEQEYERNQQRNWETVLQILGLRTQPFIISTDSFVDTVNCYNFGINYKGKHKIWTFKFAGEYADVYQNGPDKFGLLKSDFKNTPATLGLSETAVPELPLFFSSGPWNNMYFKSVYNKA